MKNCQKLKIAEEIKQNIRDKSQVKTQINSDPSIFVYITVSVHTCIWQHLPIISYDQFVTSFLVANFDCL